MILPEKYQGLGKEELVNRICAVKNKLGKKLVILGHHYQRDEVYNLADFTGDSFLLAKSAADERDAEYIVFCGVHFMAEAARILCSKKQRVFLPDMDAGCPMAEMALLEDVESAWEALQNVEGKIVPITYMNSSAAIKAFCGANGGAVCTSSNAKKIFEWAFKKGDKILFLPDEHLGRNTARLLGITGDGVLLWNSEEKDLEKIKSKSSTARVIVWYGFCHVHTFFTVDQVNEVRAKYPDCKIIVHPESKESVVALVDATGSTEQIKKYVEKAPSGSTIVIGTEINMVSRLAAANTDKSVIPLARSLCPNMFKISLNDLCRTLEELGSVNEVDVPENICKNAKLALDRMLENS